MAEAEPINMPVSAFRLRKQAAILDGARAVFLRDGFVGSNMDDVARVAGVGKQTVYRHFGSKEALFEGLLGDMCGGLFTAPPFCEAPLRETLVAIGSAFIEVVTAPINVALFRIVVAEAERFPALAARFYDAGVAATVLYVADRLAREPGVDCKEAEILAATFLEMVKGPALMALLLGAGKRHWNNDLGRQIEMAVDFLMGEVARPPTPPPSASAARRRK